MADLENSSPANAGTATSSVPKAAPDTNTRRTIRLSTAGVLPSSAPGSAPKLSGQGQSVLMPKPAAAPAVAPVAAPAAAPASASSTATGTVPTVGTGDTRTRKTIRLRQVSAAAGAAPVAAAPGGAASGDTRTRRTVRLSPAGAATVGLPKLTPAGTAAPAAASPVTPAATPAATASPSVTTTISRVGGEGDTRTRRTVRLTPAAGGAEPVAAAPAGGATAAGDTRTRRTVRLTPAAGGGEVTASAPAGGETAATGDTRTRRTVRLTPAAGGDSAGTNTIRVSRPAAAAPEESKEISLQARPAAPQRPAQATPAQAARAAEKAEEAAKQEEKKPVALNTKAMEDTPAAPPMVANIEEEIEAKKAANKKAAEGSPSPVYLALAAITVVCLIATAAFTYVSYANNWNLDLVGGNKVMLGK